MIKYERIINGIISNNTYLLYYENECIIVDPSFDYEMIDKKIAKLRLKPIGIILTHAHYDHISSCDFFVDKYGIDIYCGKNSSIYIKNPELNLSRKAFTNREEISVKSNAIIINEGDFELNKFKFKVFKTYGHSRSCTTYVIDELVITGDFIFKSTIGRTDLFDSSTDAMNESLRKFSKFDPSLIVLPGHGETSTVEFELINNPYLNRYYNE